MPTNGHEPADTIDLCLESVKTAIEACAGAFDEHPDAIFTGRKAADAIRLMADSLDAELRRRMAEREAAGGG